MKSPTKLDINTIVKNIHDSKDDLFTKQAYAKQAIEAYIAEQTRLARLEENKQALYIFENQVSKQAGMMGYLAGADRDISKGIAVEVDGQKSVLAPDNVDFSLPQFFKDRIDHLSKKGE
jgi:hypothetical protein